MGACPTPSWAITPFHQLSIESVLGHTIGSINDPPLHQLIEKCRSEFELLIDCGICTVNTPDGLSDLYPTYALGA
ncbi:hypothetical protein BJD99_01845 [Rhodococcus sp. 1163]|nr:hypothetical protein BJD99_01845 [Rhodococcus sp. 1163]